MNNIAKSYLLLIESNSDVRKEFRKLINKYLSNENKLDKLRDNPDQGSESEGAKLPENIKAKINTLVMLQMEVHKLLEVVASKITEAEWDSILDAMQIDPEEFNYNDFIRKG